MLMPKGDNIGNSFIGKNPPIVDVVEENLLGKITQDEIVEIKMDALGDYLSTHYCSIIDRTDPKKKFKMCKETDRGAMTLLNYALKKNWKIIK